MTAFEIHDEEFRPLKGKVVVITGGSSGIGLGTVKLLLDNDTYVVAGDLNDSPITNERLTFLKTNVTQWADLSALFKLAISKHGKIDHVFANAGIGGQTDYLNPPLNENGDLLEPNHAVYNINLKGVVNTVALAIHYIRQHQDGGSIVMTASASSFQRFRIVDYTATKHAVLGLMRGLTPILYPEVPVRINAISPSWTATGLVPEQILLELTGIRAQSTAVVARSVAVLMADGQRHGQLIYSVDGKFSEIEGGFRKAAADLVGEMNEDVVIEKMLKSGALGPASRPT